MKKYLMSIGILFISCTCILAQNMGKIACNKDYTATLNFNDVIVFVVVGNNPDNKYYEIFQSDKVCVIRSGNTDAPNTSITIKLQNGNVWYGTLEYGNDSKIYYDFTAQDKKEKEQIKQEEEKKIETKDALLHQRLDQIMEEKPEYLTYGIVENGMQFMVSNIKNDDKYTYLKIIVKNQTGGDYNVDGIFFKYREGKKKGVSTKEAQIEERIYPVIEPDTKVVKAYSKNELGYVIPLFSVGNKGDLEIQVREAKGTRNPVISIKGKDMLKVKVFE